MCVKTLADLFRPWMGAEAWNNNHPCDDTLFQRAVSLAFNIYGPVIGRGDFKEAFALLLEEQHRSKSDIQYWSDELDWRAYEAEMLSCCFSDVSDSPSLSAIRRLLAPDRILATYRIVP